MSDTPRTDAAYSQIRDMDSAWGSQPITALARQLERELAKANRLLAEARTMRDDFAVRLAEARRDAERYRWLRNSRRMDDVPQVYADDDCNTWLTGQELDAAIDAQLQADAAREQK